MTAGASRAWAGGVRGRFGWRPVVAGRESPRLVRVAAGGGGAGEFEARRWGGGARAGVATVEGGSLSTGSWVRGVTGSITREWASWAWE
jgi:hypothetical protein